MSEKSHPTSSQDWQLHFAKLTNNRAWDLAENPTDISAINDLLNLAHASAWHWSQVGSKREQMRSNLLVAFAHARTNFGQTAYLFSNSMIDFLTCDPDTQDWERAIAFAVHALSCLKCRKLDEFEKYLSLSQASFSKVNNPKDIKVVQKILSFIPQPQ